MGAAQCSECCAEKNGELDGSKIAKVQAMSAWVEEDVGPGGQKSPRDEDPPHSPREVRQEVPAPALRNGRTGQFGGSQRELCAEESAEESAKPELRIGLERNGAETIGINLDVTDTVSLVVVEILPGAIKSWNDARPDEERLQVNDRITEANGIRGDADKLLTALKQSTSWDLSVQRPVEFQVVINRSGSLSLGMDLRYAPNGSTLMISEIEDGPIKEWNKQSKTWKIRKLDRIIELNGIRGSSQELLHAGMEKESINMCILHFREAGEI